MNNNRVGLFFLQLYKQRLRVGLPAAESLSTFGRVRMERRYLGKQPKTKNRTTTAMRKKEATVASALVFGAGVVGCRQVSL